VKEDLALNYKNNSKIMIDLLIDFFAIDRLIYVLILLVIIYVIYFTYS
jgi:hypothetical protein